VPEADDCSPVGFGPGSLVVPAAAAGGLDRISDGFRVEYSGLILYEYRKI
jgi:hypothetical protein